MAKTTLEVNAKVDKALKEFKKLKDKMDDISNNFDGIAVASTVAFGGLIASLGLAGKHFGEFQDRMRSVKTLLDEGSFKDIGKTLNEGFKDFEKETLGVLKQMPVDIEKASKSLFDFISAGVPASKANQAMAEAAKLAIAGQTDVATATDGLTSALNAYGISADKANVIAGKFFLAQKSGKTTIAELSTDFGKVGATAAAMNVGFEEVLASVSAMTLAGIKTNEAYTGLKAVLAGISAPTTQAAEEAKRLGVEFDLGALKSKGLKKFLDDLKNSAGFTSDSIVQLFGSTEAQNAVFALTGQQASKFDSILKTLSDDVGGVETVNTAFAEQMSTLPKKLDSLKNKVFATSVEFGEKLAPALEKVVDIGTGLVDFLSNLSDGQKEFLAYSALVAAGVLGSVAAFTGFLAILGPVTTGFFELQTGLSVVVPFLKTRLVGAIGAASKAFMAFSTFMLTNPIGLALTAIAVSVAAFKVAWDNNFGGIQEKTVGTIAALKKAFTSFYDNLNELSRGVADIIEGSLTLDPGKVKRGYDKVKTTIAKTLKDTTKAYRDAHDEREKLNAESLVESSSRMAAEVRITKDGEAEKLATTQKTNREKDLAEKRRLAEIAKGYREWQDFIKESDEKAAEEKKKRDEQAKRDADAKAEAEAKAKLDLQMRLIRDFASGGLQKVAETAAAGFATTFMGPLMGEAVGAAFGLLSQSKDKFLNFLNSLTDAKFIKNIVTNLATAISEVLLNPAFWVKFANAVISALAAGVGEAFTGIFDNLVGGPNKSKIAKFDAEIAALSAERESLITKQTEAEYEKRLAGLEKIVTDSEARKADIQKKYDDAVAEYREQKRAEMQRAFDEEIAHEKEAVEEATQKRIDLEQRLIDLRNQRSEVGKSEEQTKLENELIGEQAILDRANQAREDAKRALGDAEADLFYAQTEEQRQLLRDQIKTLQAELDAANEQAVEAQENYNEAEIAKRQELGLAQKKTLDEQIAETEAALAVARAKELQAIEDEAKKEQELKKKYGLEEQKINQEGLNALKSQLDKAIAAELKAREMLAKRAKELRKEMGLPDDSVTAQIDALNKKIEELERKKAEEQGKPSIKDRVRENVTGGGKGPQIRSDHFMGEVDKAVTNPGHAVKDVGNAVASVFGGDDDDGGWPFARGGIIKPRYAARGMFVRRGLDTVPAMLQPGEMILNNSQQRRLFDIADGRGEATGGSGPQNIIVTIRGEGAFKTLVENAIIEANAIGTGRIKVAAGSED